MNVLLGVVAREFGLLFDVEIAVVKETPVLLLRLEGTAEVELVFAGGVGVTDTEGNGF